ncbi:MAG: hypothetical protein ABH871_03660 [Pseudomonadota bacterium]
MTSPVLTTGTALTIAASPLFTDAMPKPVYALVQHMVTIGISETQFQQGINHGAFVRAKNRRADCCFEPNLWVQGMVELGIRNSIGSPNSITARRVNDTLWALTSSDRYQIQEVTRFFYKGEAFESREQAIEHIKAHFPKGANCSHKFRNISEQTSYKIGGLSFRTHEKAKKRQAMLHSVVLLDSLMGGTYSRSHDMDWDHVQHAAKMVRMFEKRGKALIEMNYGKELSEEHIDLKDPQWHLNEMLHRILRTDGESPLYWGIVRRLLRIDESNVEQRDIWIEMFLGLENN